PGEARSSRAMAPGEGRVSRRRGQGVEVPLSAMPRLRPTRGKRVSHRMPGMRLRTDSDGDAVPEVWAGPHPQPWAQSRVEAWALEVGRTTPGVALFGGQAGSSMLVEVEVLAREIGRLHG